MQRAAVQQQQVGQQAPELSEIIRQSDYWAECLASSDALEEVEPEHGAADTAGGE